MCPRDRLEIDFQKNRDGFQVSEKTVKDNPGIPNLEQYVLKRDFQLEVWFGSLTCWCFVSKHQSPTDLWAPADLNLIQMDSCAHNWMTHIEKPASVCLPRMFKQPWKFLLYLKVRQGSALKLILLSFEIEVNSLLSEFRSYEFTSYLYGASVTKQFTRQWIQRK